MYRLRTYANESGLDLFISRLAGLIRIVVYLVVGLSIGLYISSAYATHYINNWTVTHIMEKK